MSLSAQQVEIAVSVLSAIEPGKNPLPVLRQELEGVSVSRCDAEDMNGEIPYRRLPAFDMFLVDAASHCWRLVADPMEASGVIVSARSSS
ncbi:MAG: hypothetical protein RugAbin2_01973 [Rugosibacter sp.]|jgi:hypothetical protein|nr:hypothetical protein [Rugosibacter sp.]